jgi:hypothetical protein
VLTLRIERPREGEARGKVSLQIGNRTSPSWSAGLVLTLRIERRREGAAGPLAAMGREELPRRQAIADDQVSAEAAGVGVSVGDPVVVEAGAGAAAVAVEAGARSRRVTES